MSKNESISFIRAARNLGILAESYKVEDRSKSEKNKKYRVVVYLDKNDIPKNVRARKLNPWSEGRWDVDIYNLPIPQSAYPAASFVEGR